MRRLLVSMTGAVLALSLLANPSVADAAGSVTRGADYAWYRPSATTLANANVGFVVRYILPASFGSGKALTASEAGALHAHGYTIVLNFEYSATAALGGYNAGIRDAQRAELARKQVGAPSNIPIYFSADFDATAYELPSILAYLRGASSVIGKARIGVYGSYKVVRAALNQGFPYAWQTYAWSGGVWDSRAQIRQVKNGVLFGGLGDLDQMVSRAYGGWVSGTGTTPLTPATGGSAGGSSSPSGGTGTTTTVYVVRAGDTLSTIAKAHGTTYQALAALNGISNPNRIYAGERLKLTASAVSAAPSVTRVYYTVKHGDTLGALAKKYGTTFSHLAALNGLRNVNLIYAGQTLRVR